MNETEWLTSPDPVAMLEYLKRCRRYRVSARKVLLFGCRAVRRISKLLEYQESENAIRVAERFADGRCTASEMDQARRDARLACNAVHLRNERPSEYHAAQAAWCLTRIPNTKRLKRLFVLNTTQELLWEVFRIIRDDATHTQREKGELANLLREVVGNPFRRVSIDPDWLRWNDRTVVRIAQTIYQERKWREMPILGDALEDTGCTQAVILDHCRAATIHCRGCWLLDEIMDSARECIDAASYR